MTVKTIGEILQEVEDAVEMESRLLTRMKADRRNAVSESQRLAADAWITLTEARVGQLMGWRDNLRALGALWL